MKKLIFKVLIFCPVTAYSLFVISSCNQRQYLANVFGASIPCSKHLIYYTGVTDHLLSLDLYVPQISLPGNAPKPLVVFIHGGGFIDGDKQDTKDPTKANKDVASFLNDGFAFASINYPLVSLDPPDEVGMIKCLQNCRDAIQHLRIKASTYGIDPNNIAICGESAGAGLAMLIGFNVPITPNPIKVIYASIPQATYKIKDWHDLVFQSICSENEICDILSTPSPSHPELKYYMQSIYGMGQYTGGAVGDPFPCSDVMNFIDSDYPAKVDILSFIDTGDPPIWIENDQTKNNINLSNCNDPDDTTIPYDLMQKALLNHHVNHAIILKDTLVNIKATGWFFKDKTTFYPFPPPLSQNNWVKFVKSKL